LTTVEPEDQQIVERATAEDGEDKTEIRVPTRRAPGRPKSTATKRPNLPEKKYYLRSKDKQTPKVIKSSSEDEVEGHESMYALFTGEISFSDAVTGPDSNEWKNVIYEEIKSLVTNDTWDLVKG